MVGVVGSGIMPLQVVRAVTGLSWIGLAILLFALVVWLRWRVLIIISLFAGFVLGVGRGGAERFALQQYRPLYGAVVAVKGLVSDDASIGLQGDMRLSLSHIQVGSRVFHGTVWVSLARAGPVKRGDVLLVRGTLSQGFGAVSASMYRAELIRIEHSASADIARQVRDWFAAGISKAIPQPQAALGIGYLTGQHATLPNELVTQLQAVGLTHAVVASGYNLTILVALARALFARISKYLATLAASLMIVGFMMITGLSPSMSRAGLVSGLSLAAWYYGRTINPLVLLPFSAAITVLFNPAYIWGDIGWYLSFAAFAGVLVVGPLLEAFFWDDADRSHAIGAMIVETVSAEIVTAPIILLAFGQYAAYALLANILVLPLIPVTMLLTFLAGLAGVSIVGLAHWVGLPASGVLHYMTWTVAHIAALPAAQREVHIKPWMAAMYYCLLLCGLWWLQRRTMYRFGVRHKKRLTI